MPLCQHQVLCSAGDGIPVFVLARQAPHQVSHSSSSLYNMAEATRFQKWIVRAWGGKNKEEGMELYQISEGDMGPLR